MRTATDDDADLAVAMSLSEDEAQIHHRFNGASQTPAAAAAAAAAAADSTNTRRNNNNTFRTGPGHFQGSQQAKDQEDVRIARIMFLAGCCLLPWLWIASIIFFRKRIFDGDAPAALHMCE